MTQDATRYTTLALERQTSPESEKAVYCLKLRCPDAYEPGDWLLVRPVNPDSVVRQTLKALKIAPDQPVSLKRIGETSARKALECHLEITQLDPAFLNRLKRQFDIGPWQTRREMADYAQRRNLPDLLCDFPEVRALGTELLPQLSPLAPRFYSIASAREAVGDEAHILFRVVSHRSCGRDYPGAATHMLSRLKPGDDIAARIQRNRRFKLPEDPHRPIAMLAAGVGLAPFIGFMQARTARQAPGENWLFFGETRRSQTFLCRTPLQRWAKAGQLHLVTAFSRDQTEKIYIQHRMQEYADTLRRLHRAGAVFYLCGDRRRMAPAVLRTLETILDASSDRLQQAGALQLDIF